VVERLRPYKGRYLTMVGTAPRTFSRYAKKRKNWTMQHPPGRTFGAIAVVADLLLMACGRAVAADGPPGITRPVVLPPFNAAAPNPPGLQRVLAFAQDNQRKFMQGIASGLGLLPCSFHFFGREACYAWNCRTRRCRNALYRKGSCRRGKGSTGNLRSPQRGICTLPKAVSRRWVHVTH
jgi:hypothetical protein